MDLKHDILNSKAGCSISTLNIVNRFTPLIHKYSNLLNYEDANNDLIERLLITIIKIPSYVNNDGKIINYIKNSMHNSYVNLLIKQKKNNHSFPADNLDLCFSIEESFTDNIDLKDSINLLSDRRKLIITYKYYYGYTDIEIGSLLKISRQSVYKNKQKALSQLRQHLENRRIK